MKKILGIFVLVILISGITPVSSATGIYSLSYETLSGEDSSFSIYEGENLVVEAFKTDCEYCIDYHPRLSSMYDSYSDNLTLISISTDTDDTPATIEEFKDEHPTDWEMGLEKDDLKDNFGIRGTPTTLMFNPSGDLQVCIVGAVEESDLMDHTEKFLTNPDYTYNIEDGACTPPTLLERIFSSFLFPIIGVLIIYGIFLLVRNRMAKKSE